MSVREIISYEIKHHWKEYVFGFSFGVLLAFFFFIGA